jgi:hypothetical protein
MSRADRAELTRNGPSSGLGGELRPSYGRAERARTARPNCGFAIRRSLLNSVLDSALKCRVVGQYPRPANYTGQPAVARIGRHLKSRTHQRPS